MVSLNHHLTSVSTYPKFFAQQFFYERRTHFGQLLLINISMMLTTVQLYFLLGMGFGAGIVLALALVIWAAVKL